LYIVYVLRSKILQLFTYMTDIEIDESISRDKWSARFA